MKFMNIQVITPDVGIAVSYKIKGTALKGTPGANSFPFMKRDAIDDFLLFDLILYVPSTIFQLNRDGSSWVEPVLS